MSFQLPEMNAAPQKTLNVDSTWTLDTTVSDVQCYYKIVSCNDRSVVLLRFNNQNDGAVKITWQEEFKTQLNDNEPGFYGPKELTLNPGESDEYDCSSDNSCVIRHSQVQPTYPAEISGFRFIEINVNIL